MRLKISAAYQQSKGFSLFEVMVAIAILAIAIVAIFQHFSTTLKTTKKADDYTRALFYARSMLDEAYSASDITEISDSLEFEGNYLGSREVILKSSSEDEKAKIYEIIITVTWPPSGSLKLKGLRTVYEPEE